MDEDEKDLSYSLSALDNTHLETLEHLTGEVKETATLQ